MEGALVMSGKDRERRKGESIPVILGKKEGAGKGDGC